MFDANPDNVPPPGTEVPVSGTPAPVAGGTTSYPTPPKLPSVMNPEQRAAVEGEVRATTQQSGGGRGLLSGIVFGAIIGGIVGLVSRKGLLLKTGIGAGVGGISGFALSNMTWSHKPDIEAPIGDTMEKKTPAQTPPVSLSHVDQVQTSRETTAAKRSA